MCESEDGVWGWRKRHLGCLLILQLTDGYEWKGVWNQVELVPKTTEELLILTSLVRVT